MAKTETEAEDRELTPGQRNALVRGLNDYEDFHVIQDGEIYYQDQLLDPQAAIGRLERLIDKAIQRNKRNLMLLGRLVSSNLMGT